MHMEWWIWIIGGLVLLGIELFVPMGFYLFIMGLSCLTVGALAYMNILTDANNQYLVVAILGIALMFLVRKPLAAMMMSLGKETGSDITAQKVTVSETILPGASGRGEHSGTTWNVRNDTEGTLNAGHAYRVSRTEGLTLIVKDL